MLIITFTGNDTANRQLNKLFKIGCNEKQSESLTKSLNKLLVISENLKMEKGRKN